MTHDVDTHRVYHVKTAPLEPDLVRHFFQIDITALDSAGTENFDATDYVETVESVRVVGQADETVIAVYDTADNNLKLKNISDASNVSNNDATGIFKIEVVGQA